MKCGSCRDRNADNYERIKQDNNLFEILRKLNPHRAYNAKHSYFCDVCINLAKTKLSQIVSTMSDQNPNSINLNVSTLTNATNTSASDSSKDEYDYMVMSKYVFSDTGTPILIPQNRSRSKRLPEDTEKQKPCPKRFKKPLVPIQLSVNPPVQHPSSQQKSSDSILDHEMLLNVQQSASPVSLKPCPKRFKNPSGTMHMPTIQETSSEEKSSQAHSSESISVNEMLLDVEHAASYESSPSVEQQSHSPVQQDLDSLSSKDSPSQPVVTSAVQSINQPTSKGQPKAVPTQAKLRSKPQSKNRLQYDSDSDASDSSNLQTTNNRPKAVHTQSSVVNKSRPTTLLQYDSDSDSDEPDSSNRQTTVGVNNRQVQQRLTVQDAIAGPSAPTAKNPRIRQNMPSNIRQFFSTQNFNVNNYSRSLAG